jgi:serine/threonine protein kinase
VREKIPISRLIDGLREARIYDSHTMRKLDVLTAAMEGPSEISKKERTVTEDLFSRLIEKVGKNGFIEFEALAPQDSIKRGERVRCSVAQFLGFGNMGPVYEVRVNNQPYALKIYSAAEVKDMTNVHGRFGLAGVLQELESQEGGAFLSDLGKTVLARKAKGTYGSCKRVVKIHNVGSDAPYMFVLMDMLAVDPINRVDLGALGGDALDLVSWAVDCAVGLCTLHVEERRLHLNIRPEAFIKQEIKGDKRLPIYTFFHFPTKFSRRPDGPSAGTSFILVDHFDTSVPVTDKTPKGLGAVGSWLYLPPEQILQLLRSLREDYDRYVEQKAEADQVKTIRLKRSQMDDIWALGLTFYQLFSGGKLPIKQATTLADMVNSVLLTKFDFSSVPHPFRELTEALLAKNPKDRFQLTLKGCPEKLCDRGVLGEAILYKLEQIGIEHGD